MSKDVALLDGVLAFGLLIFLQFIITWLSVRSGWISDLVKAKPVLLVYQGELLQENMLKERITREEVMAAVRTKGIGSLAQVGAVVLETEGTLSIIKEVRDIQDPVFENVSLPSARA